MSSWYEGMTSSLRFFLWLNTAFICESKVCSTAFRTLFSPFPFYNSSKQRVTVLVLYYEDVLEAHGGQMILLCSAPLLSFSVLFHSSALLCPMLHCTVQNILFFYSALLFVVLCWAELTFCLLNLLKNTFSSWGILTRQYSYLDYCSECWKMHFRVSNFPNIFNRTPGNIGNDILPLQLPNDIWWSCSCSAAHNKVHLSHTVKHSLSWTVCPVRNSYTELGILCTKLVQCYPGCQRFSKRRAMKRW